MTTESTTKEPCNIVAWTRNNVLIKWPCVVCGGETGRQEILAIAYAGSQSYENEIGMVCDQCVDAGAAAVAARFTHEAEHLEAQAAELRRDPSPQAEYLEAQAAELRRSVAEPWQFPPEEQTRTFLQDLEGHDPNPSFLFDTSELVTPGYLMPADFLGCGNPPDDTCYPGCPRCAEMAAPRLGTVTTHDRESEEPGGRPQLPPDDSGPPEVWDDGFFEKTRIEVVA